MAPNPELRPATILIAEDDPQVLGFLCEALKGQGCRLTAVADGDEALDVVLNQPVDVALFGLNIPGWNGFSLCSVVKSNSATRSTPVVLLTGRAAIEDRIRGLECGADEFLATPVRKEELLARVHTLLKMKQLTDDAENTERALFSLALSIEARDPYTHQHCERLMKYSAAVADHFVLPTEQREALRQAALIHDIGKVSLPDAILLKPGPLSADERGVMQQHPLVGERVCSSLAFFRGALPIVRYHHERMDGTGYPDGLKGDQIPVTARILTIADVYDALTTDRPFRKALPQRDAIDTMHREAAAGWLDPSLLEVFEYRASSVAHSPVPS